MPDEFVIEDDALAPKGYILIDYKGMNPFSIYAKMRDILLTIFRAGGKDFFEDDFRWDLTTEPVGFFVNVHVERKFDKWTKYYIFVRLQGKQPKDPSKPGWIQVEISGKVITKYPTETLLQKAIFYPFLFSYHYLIYNNIRRRYLGIHNERIEQLEKEIRSTFGMTQRIGTIL